MEFPDPVIKVAIEPKTKADVEKMSTGLIKLAQEDPSFHFTRHEETNQTVIEGMGELHLDIIVDLSSASSRLKPMSAPRKSTTASPSPSRLTSSTPTRNNLVVPVNTPRFKSSLNRSSRGAVSSLPPNSRGAPSPRSTSRASPAVW